MFVTNFVLMAQLEAYELGAIDLNLEDLNLSVDALLKFHDKNYD
jgi:hypothetical protein